MPIGVACFLLLTAFTSRQESNPGLTAGERKGIADALFLRNLTEQDLDFVRRAPDQKGIPVVQNAIDQPLKTADDLLRIHASAANLPLELLGVAEVPDPPKPAVVIPSTVPAPLQPIVKSLVEAIATANQEIVASLSALTGPERRILIDSLPQLAAGSETKFDFVKAPAAKRQEVEALLAKVSLPRLLATANRLDKAVQAEIPALKNLHIEIAESIDFTAAGVPVEIGTTGRDIHKRSVGGLCLDLGGDDVYTGRYGAGAGLASVLIDVAGNDDYATPDLSMGAGLLGIGLAYDLGGNDRFQCGSLTLGAGLGGLGLMYKEGGDDIYVSGSLTQGFGRSGIGLLRDTGGVDRYRIHAKGQGCGLASGIGWLIDDSGDDQYVAEGPLAQGAGAGGVGLLTDKRGNDSYQGTSECQGYGASLGLGSLYDGAGKDTYIADRAAVAFATDSGAAYLFDLAGDDVYAVRGGACLGAAQGRSVAFLLDREGNDIYTAIDGRPGLATDGSLAIFLDDAGHDRYGNMPGGSVPGRSGNALALFLDLGGQDGYPDGPDDGVAKVETEGSVAYDVYVPPTLNASDFPGPSPGSAADPGVPGIDALWDAGSSQAANRLVGIGLPALRRFLETRMKSPDAWSMQTAVRLARLLGPSSRPSIVATLASDDEVTLSTALVLIGASGALEAAPRVARLLKIPALQKRAAETAGLLRATEAASDLLPLAGSSDPDLALTAMLALERIADQTALPTAEALLTSPQYPIRQSAMRFLAQFSASATRAADHLLEDPDPRVQRFGIELLGRLGTPEALVKAGTYLTKPNPGLKIQAMLALQGKCPVALRPTLLGLRDDVDPSVRAVAARIDPGR